MKFDLAHFSDNYLGEDPNQIAARARGVELGTLDAPHQALALSCDISHL